MDTEGLLLEGLTHRLAETPPDFLDEPRIGTAGRVAVAAVVNDILALHGQRATIDALRVLHGKDPRADRNRLALSLVAAWLLSDPAFVRLRLPHAHLLALFHSTVAELAAVAPAQKFVQDPDRREELARTVLARLGLRPHGETAAQAADRLASISSTERRRLIEASRAAEQRARAIREALARKAAEESADKWTRE